MPWKVGTPMSLRKEFIALAQSDGVNMSELCRRMEISRKTGYKWLRRYAQAGGQSLHDLPRRPHTSPQQTSREMEELVVEVAPGASDQGCACAGQDVAGSRLNGRACQEYDHCHSQTTWAHR